MAEDFEDRDLSGINDPTASKNLLRVLHGFERILLGPLTPNVRTPSRIEYMWEHADLLHYFSREEPSLRVPILIIPPLMVTSDIFDLRPGHSMVESLIDAGHDVFLLRFGAPRDIDVHLRIDDYVLDFLPNAVDRILETTGAPSLSLLGWSMGGIFIALYTAMQAPGTLVKNIITLGSPVDFSKMFPFNLMARVTRRPLMEIIDRIGNIPPFLTRNGFKLLRPVALVRRYLELTINLWDREWVAGFETIDQWVDAFIPYPGDTFKQFVSDFIISDKMKSREIRFAGRIIDLSKITCSALVVSGTKDNIAPGEAVEPLLDMISSTDTRLVRAPVGHIGLVAGSRAQESVWKEIIHWLGPRSREF